MPSEPVTLPFALSFAERPEAFRVTSFVGREQASKLYRLDVRVTTDALDDELAASLVDARATLSILDGGEPVRAVHGVVARVESHGTFLHDRQALSLALVPALWRLRRRRTRRIFQDLTTLEIAAVLLGEWGVASRAQVHHELPRRGYAVQYDETDHAFLARLLAEDGIFTYFDHPLAGPTEILVLADTPADYAPLDRDPRLRFERVDPAGGMSAREDHVTWFVPRRRVRSTRALVRGYDFRRPDVDIRVEAPAAPVAMGGTPKPPGSEAPPRTVYEHEGSYEDDLGPRAAGLRLDQEQHKQAVAEGASFCRRLAPGRRFSLSGHDLASLDRGWVVTLVEHEGYEAGVVPHGRATYQNRFHVVPDDAPIRPPHRPERPRQVAETAVVVGPPGQEIHTDAFGRVKVRFHWDLEARGDDRSSCWLRVAQAWAGVGWGAQFIPRVGMEVLVTYLGGDPDRPLVTGAVYNATHPPPFPLPEHRTRSGIRTWSTPAAVGANELSFEDSAGGEQIYVHAQRDYEESIERDRSSRVGGSETSRVDGKATARVGRDATLEVAGVHTTRVGGHQAFEIGGNQRGQVKGDHALEVAGDSATTVIKGHALEVRGNRSLVVGTDGGSAHSDHFVHGAASLGATDRVTLRADQGLLIQCGGASIELSPTKITLRAPTVELAASEALECSAKGGPSVTLGDDVEILTKKFRLFTESGAFEADQDIKVKGASIKLGYDPSKPTKSAKDETPEKKPFTCKLADYFLKPYANKKYHLMAEGLRFEGETDGGGNVKEQVPKSAKQVVVRLWLDKYPEGRQRVYTLKLAELPPVADMLGVKERLKNLGYYAGSMDAVASDELRASVSEFQSDHKDTHALEPTGELDPGTRGALEEVHGS